MITMRQPTQNKVSIFETFIFLLISTMQCVWGLVLIHDTWYLVLGTWYLVLGTWYLLVTSVFWLKILDLACLFALFNFVTPFHVYSDYNVNKIY